MYCKYCGNKITSDTIKCTFCGATIDLDDGGQSFFDDKELNDWQNDGLAYNTQTNIPKTEIMEPLPKDSNFEETFEQTFTKHQSSIGTRASHSHARSKKKKNILDYLNLSNSNKLIIFCIASALVIVLLVVAIIAVLNRGKDNTDNVTQNNSLGYAQQQDNTYAEQNIQQLPNVDNSTVEPKKDSTQKNTIDNMTEIKDIKIFDKDQKEISHSVSAFVDEKGVLYVSLDRVLKHEGYKTGTPNQNDPNRVIYEHKTNGKVIEIEKQTNKMWIKSSGESPIAKNLDGNNFNIEYDTYVPIKSFLVELGYDKDKIKWDSKEKVLYFKK